MVHISIPPEPGTPLADLLTRLQAAQEANAIHSQAFGLLREQCIAANTAARRAVYTRKSQEQCDELDAKTLALHAERDRQLAQGRVTQEQVNALTLEWDREYGRYLRAKQREREA